MRHVAPASCRPGRIAGETPPLHHLLVVLLALAACPAAWAEKVTIYRDSWGIPHIYAETERGAAFGQGYAAAEDRLEAILRNYREATGRMAEAFGEKYVKHDFEQRAQQHEQVSRARYQELPTEVRALLEAYVAGLQRYMKEHPEKVPAWAPKVEPWHPVALGRYVIFGWPMREVNAELGRRVQAVAARSSNQWAISPSRTALGAAILCIDPHVPFDGPFRFHEVRLHGGDLHLSGAGIAGTPLIGLGHNRYLGWAATTGGPDTTDVYEEELNPANPSQYKYDGQWRAVRVEKIRIDVKSDNGLKPVEKELRHTHHGPIVLQEGNRAYAVKTPYLDQVQLTTALYRQVKARNLEEFKAALGMNQWMQQNIMYADVEGNIYYLRTGRVPIRPNGYDWSRPVPGNTSATEWLGIHPLKDLLQVLNPPDGYIQNCNADPMTLMAHPPYKPSDYPAYLYNDIPYRYNPRAERSREVLEANRRMTLQDAMGLALDTVVDGAQRYQAALAAAAEANAEDPLVEKIRRPLQILLAWDGRLEADSAAATLFDAWARAARADLSPQEQAIIRKGDSLSAEKQKKMLEALGRAAGELQQKHGSIEVPWGKLRRVVRGNASFPAAGGAAGGVTTLRALGFSGPNERGEYAATNGQSMTTLVVFKKTGAESYSALPWGNSDDPASPHFADQAEKLLSRKVLKPTWFDKKQLLPHVVSQKTLEM